MTSAPNPEQSSLETKRFPEKGIHGRSTRVQEQPPQPSFVFKKTSSTKKMSSEQSFETLLAGFEALDDRLKPAYESIKRLLKNPNEVPRVGIVCGSGLGELANKLSDSEMISYDQIDQWPRLKTVSVVQGHEAKGLVFGKLGKTRVVCQSGRLHFYEGYEIKDVIFTVRLFKLLGCQAVIITNAAGAVNPSIPVGTIVALHDHVSLPSLAAFNPLMGPNSDIVGPRFTPMSDAYDFELRKSVFRSISQVGLQAEDVQEGVYAWVTGPTYETKAEGLFLRSMGADVVGMSTVPEVIAARHAGLRVLTLSLVTNCVVITARRSAAEAVSQDLVAKDEGHPSIGLAWKEETANHEEVLEVGRKKAESVIKIVNYVVNDPIW
ncbi:hypothetical protein Pst134EA_005228 [Puccinia striiformis f. sp. tritici]|uniref:purine-nucleoside phosphorylase n=1 Tax=Puccinia striiformis TaxID=27350 RepID=A0A2S4WDG4_9BASI|nr:hypothetical protein Pst134EA_005228 [Puccinia striiformis f. sp. tritici]KAH9471328.1 hypothetical protein Pst134EA_005228 [Puccinia striiformis f. sp. tritici]POW19804.1 hypothetical protein PSHT_04246 [Puccinia striiformis]